MQLNYKKLIAGCILLAQVLSEGFGQIKQNSNTAPYPYGNPVITHMYTADAAPHVMPDGKVWMVTSVDHENGGGYATMHQYHSFSSSDLVHWTDHGQILHVSDLWGEDGEPEGEDWALWAPDMVYYHGTYYLYFPVRILHTDTLRPGGGRVVTSYIAVAKSDSPDRRFRVVNPRIKGTQGIDPCIFIDNDGERYLYFGSHMGSRLKPNMIELEGNAVRLDVDDPRFMEAIWMHRRNNTYYISYHTLYDKPVDPDNPDDPRRRKSRLDYGTGSDPMGPFTYGGILNYELGVNVKGPHLPGKNYVPWRLFQSNHGGIVEYHGQEYLFYHTSALSSWRQDTFRDPGTWTQRSVCIDSLNYREDGSVIPVRQSLEGVAPVHIDQPYALYPDRSGITPMAGIFRKGEWFIQSGKRSSIRIDSLDLGSGYYYFSMIPEPPKGRVFIEVRLDQPNGHLAGTIILNGTDRGNADGSVETFLRGASGTHTVYLMIRAEGPGREWSFREPRFYAGAPLTK